MLESESRWASVIQTRWAAIADPYKLTIAGWAGFAVSHLKSIYYASRRGIWSPCSTGFVGCRQACCPTHFETITIEQTNQWS